MRFTLKKDEKLRHKRLVEELFSTGKSIYDFPLRAVFRIIDNKELENSFKAGIPPKVGTLQMLITVPKKKRRHAVDRVLMRRRIREAYRLNRIPLKELSESLPDKGTISIAFVYMSDKNLPYSLIENKMQKILYKIEQQCSGS